MSALAEQVREVCLPLEDTLIDGPIRRQIHIYSESSCFEGCVHGSPLCHPGSSGFHGQRSREIVFIVSVLGKGAVAFDLHSPIYAETPRTPRHKDWRPLGPVVLHYATPPEYLRDLGWGPRECGYIDAQCWSDVTYLAADECVAALVAEGPKGVWALLAEKWLPDVMEAAS